MKKIFVVSPYQEEISNFIHKHFSIQHIDKMVLTCNKMILPEEYAYIYVLIKENDLEWWNFYIENDNENIKIIKIT